MKAVGITAHRGSSATAPENTQAAFRQAIADGADYIELDAQTCADGTVVVLHDRDLQRVAGDPRRVEDLTLAELETVDVGRRHSEAFSGERIPTLAEVIQLVRGKVKLNIELKYNRPEPRLVTAVIQLLRAESFVTNCVVSSFNASAIHEVKRAEPRIHVGLIAAEPMGHWSQVRADFLSVSASLATPELIREAHEAGQQVHVWTVNEPKLMRRLIELGADNLITDRPGVLRQLFTKRSGLDPTRRQSG